MACYRPVGGLTYWPCCHLGLKKWLHQSQVGCNQQHRHWYFGIREQKKKWFLPVKYPAEITVTRRIDYNLLLEKQHSTAYFDAHDRQLNSSRKVLCKYPYSDIQWLICVVFCNTPCLPCMAVWVITIKYKKQKQCCFTVYLETDHDLHTICSSWHLIFFLLILEVIISCHFFFGIIFGFSFYFCWNQPKFMIALKSFYLLPRFVFTNKLSFLIFFF